MAIVPRTADKVKPECFLIPSTLVIVHTPPCDERNKKRYTFSGNQQLPIN